MSLYAIGSGKCSFRQYFSNLIAYIAFALFVMAVAVATLTVGVSAVPSVQASDSPQIPACSPNWVVTSSPNPGVSINLLAAVAATSANDVWGVGDYHNGTHLQTLVEHWNGTRWSMVSSPNLGSEDNFLTGVSVVSPSDVWAVGYFTIAGNISRTLAEHWNGTIWSILPTLDPEAGGDILLGVAATSSNDVWAVGYSVKSGNISRTLIERWNGTAWSVVSSPDKGSSFNKLYGVAAVSAGDVWAVGYYIDRAAQTLTEHWNGTAWSVVSSPDRGSGSNYLQAISATSVTNIWAVGNYVGAGSINQTLIEHWNGTAWSIVSSPNQGANSNFLYGVAVASTNDVWAIGFYVNDRVVQALTQHWNGSVWSVVQSQNPGFANNSLYGVTATSSGDIWAVGNYYGPGPVQTLVMHCNPFIGSN